MNILNKGFFPELGDSNLFMTIIVLEITVMFIMIATKI